MTQEIVVSHDDYETQVAILEDGRVTEVFRSGDQDQEVRGDIYLGRVKSVLPGIQVAFVDIGLDRDAFLHVSDIVWTSEVLKSTSSNNPGALTEACRKIDRIPRGRHESINKLVREGQRILVQIDKSAMREKGPRVTAQIRIPGRYLVLMPSSKDIGISRRIDREEERNRLKDMILKMRKDAMGFIVRTVAEGKDKSDIKHDMDSLAGQWKAIQNQARRQKRPQLLYQEGNIVMRIIRDRMTQETSQIVMDSEEIHEEVLDHLHENLPHLVDKAVLYKGQKPLFEARGVTQELRRALGQKVWLPSGGYITIEQTEALVVIDVCGSSFVEDPVRINLEAVEEIVRQMRLRDIGGIMVIAFLEMESTPERRKVHQALQRALQRDRAATNILRFSELGLVQMTRQRTRRSLQGALCQECPYCEGHGWTLSTEAIALDVLRNIKRMRKQARRPGLKVVTNDVIANRLRQQDKDKVAALEKSLRFQIEVEGDVDLHLEDYRILNLQNNSEIFSTQ